MSTTIDLNNRTITNGYDSKIKAYKTSNEIKSSIQVSYPTSIDTVENTNGTFYLSNTLPNFTYTNATKSTYISGSAVQAFVTRIQVKVPTNKTYTNSLVIKHTGATQFYVVIPLVYDKKSKTTISALLNNEKTTMNLNSDISNPDANTSIYHCTASVSGTATTPGTTHIFVFDKPITVSTQSPKVSTDFNISTPVTPLEVVTSTIKIEEGVDCQTGEEEEEEVQAAKAYTITYFVHLIMLLVDFTIIMICYGIMGFVENQPHIWIRIIFGLIIVLSGVILAWSLTKTKIIYLNNSSNRELAIIVSGNLIVASFIGLVMSLFPKSMFTASIASLPAASPASPASIAKTPPVPKGIKSGWLGFTMP
jgi:hypothetical protein